MSVTYPAETDVLAAASSKHTPRYKVNPGGVFRIEDYDLTPPFSSMLPGIAGFEGIPLWCLYVNRGQGVVSFGVDGKDGAVAEYLPATWAYQLVGLQGFRTFLKIDGAFVEPFAQRMNGGGEVHRSMSIEPDALTLADRNDAAGVRCEVQYFSSPNERVGNLVRTVTVENTADAPRRFSVLDGLAVMVPAGCTDNTLKSMRRLAEAYAAARLLNDHISLFQTRVRAHDAAEVQFVEQANFFASWLVVADRLLPLSPIVDPFVVFGEGNGLVVPSGFLERDGLAQGPQQWENRFACAFSEVQQSLAPGESLTLVSVLGAGANEGRIADHCARYVKLEDVHNARRSSRAVVRAVTDPALTISADPAFDAHARQNLLDNVLRGGVPVVLPSRDGPAPIPVYARRHGDLERDYNAFVLPPTPLSAGGGNYRDILQNRRNDVWLYPELDDEEIRMFISLLQPDGYNPLRIDGYRWAADPGDLPACPTEDVEAKRQFEKLIAEPFTPGALLDWLADHDVRVPERHRWLESVLSRCHRTLVADGYEGGFWIDHWTYLTDLLDSYARLHPERVRGMLVDKADIGWFIGSANVRPRSEKHVRRHGRWYQLGAVDEAAAPGKPLPPVTLFGKLAALVAIKAVSFDVDGRGIEMEAGRPGWNDSLNGLPGQFGSSTCEAAELARLARWLVENSDPPPDTQLPEEVAELVQQVVADLELPDYCWERGAGIREAYRARVRSASGASAPVSADVMTRLLKGAERRARAALKQAVDGDTGLIHTYYVRRPNGDQASGTACACEPQMAACEYTAEPLPLFLEGQVHWLRVLEDPAQARAVWKRVRSSELFDRKLEMYKLNVSLQARTDEIGRARTFTPGWYENESVWVHMSYKYLLELLHHGLYEEFFTDARTMMVPFMDAATYGRSVLENSSFIVSSANPDERLHGRGFVGRLSGTTTEFIDIWQKLTLGLQPFRFDGELQLKLEPILPAEWFTHEPQIVTWRDGEETIPSDAFACAVLGHTLLVYHNPDRRDTFGPQGVSPRRYEFDGAVSWSGDTLPGEIAERVRSRKCKRIDVRLG